MKKHLLFAIFVLVAGAFRGNAQSLQNTTWKAYINGPNDTVTLHIGKDTSFVTMGAGDVVVVKSICRVSKDTLSLQDFEGQYLCPDGTGVYLYTVTADKLVLKMVNDPCDGRATAINGVAWARVSKP